MTVTRFAPFRSSFGQFSAPQSAVLRSFFDFARPEGMPQTVATASFVPAVDVYEDAQKLVLKLEVPGIPKEQLHISVDGRVLTVKGERSLAAEEKQESFRRVERSYGSFTRSFTLPLTVDAESVEATAADGVLSLTLAKKPESAPKQIAVKGASEAVAASNPEVTAAA